MKMLAMMVGLMATVALPAAAEPEANVNGTVILDTILKNSVRDQRVDYQMVRSTYAKDLQLYLQVAASIDADKLPEKDRLAHLINIYNATVIKAVVDRYHEGYSVSQNDFGLFKEPLVHLSGGKTVSLNDLENKIIRPTFKDPRVHVALVCGAASCPPILARAYEGKDLNAVLDENMKRFVADSFRNKIDEGGKTLTLSKIFDWYSDDFGGKDQVPAFVGKYAGKDLSGYKVNFIEYSWELNATPAKATP